MQKPSGLKPPGRGGKHSSPVGRTSTGSPSASAAAAATGSKEGAWGQGWWGEAPVAEWFFWKSPGNTGCSVTSREASSTRKFFFTSDRDPSKN